MIKAKATLSNGTDLFVFGLSNRNLEMLKAGHPIHFSLGEIGGAGAVMIFHGQTEELMREQLREFLPADVPPQGKA